jgi:hypothetical protein
VEQVGEFTNTAIVAAANDSTPDNKNQSATVTVHPAMDAGGPYQVDQRQSTTLNGTCDSCTGHAWDLDNNGSFETSGQSVQFDATDVPPAEYPVGYQGCTGSICNEEYTTVTVLPVAFGTLMIVKDAEPDGPQDFAFTGDLGQFTLDDDDDPTLPASRTFVVVPGFHFVQESLPPGWAIADIECDANFADDGPNVTVQVDDGANVTCTFKNVKLGTIEIIKSASPEDPQDVDFDGNLGHFSLDDDNDPTLPNSRFVENLLPGSYSITEAIVPGWDLTLIQCFDPTGDTVEDLAARTATINLVAGENVTCIFTNTERAKITIIKDAEPDDLQDFDFEGDLGHFSLDDDADPTLANLTTFTDLNPGTYNVTEMVPQHWVLSVIVCDDDDSVGSPANNTATIRVESGEHVRCTFFNQKQLHQGRAPQWPAGLRLRRRPGAFHT